MLVAVVREVMGRAPLGLTREVLHKRVGELAQCPVPKRAQHTPLPIAATLGIQLPAEGVLELMEVLRQLELLEELYLLVERVEEGGVAGTGF